MNTKLEEGGGGVKALMVGPLPEELFLRLPEGALSMYRHMKRIRVWIQISNNAKALVIPILIWTPIMIIIRTWI